MDKNQAIRRCFELTRKCNELVDQSEELLAQSEAVGKEIEAICAAAGIDWTTEIDYPLSDRGFMPWEDMPAYREIVLGVEVANTPA